MIEKPFVFKDKATGEWVAVHKGFGFSPHVWASGHRTHRQAVESLIPNTAGYADTSRTYTPDRQWRMNLDNFPLRIT